MKAEISKTQTNTHLNGKWIWDENGVQVEVIITTDSLTIQHGKAMTFQIEKPISTSAHWFGDYLVFLPTLYYARYADAEVLLFGELKHPYNDVIWEKEFSRIRSYN